MNTYITSTDRPISRLIYGCSFFCPLVLHIIIYACCFLFNMHHVVVGCCWTIEMIVISMTGVTLVLLFYSSRRHSTMIYTSSLLVTNVVIIIVTYKRIKHRSDISSLGWWCLLCILFIWLLLDIQSIMHRESWI